MIYSFQPKTYAGLAKHTARCYSQHLAQQSLELSENEGAYALDMRLAEEPATAESVTAKDLNHVDTFSLDFAFSFAQEAMSAMQSGIQDDIWIQEDIAKTLLDGATVVLIIILVDKTQLLLILGDRSTPSTLLAEFILTTKIRNPLLKTDYEEQKHYNFNIHVSLATDTLHLLLKGLVMKMLDFMQDILDDIYPGKQKAIIQQLIAVVSLLFVLKAPFALHFIRAVCDLVILAQYKSHNEDTLAYIQGALERMNVFKEEFRVYRRTLGEEKNFNYSKALDSICTGANSEAHHITIVKQFYSMTNKKEYILQICLHNSWRTALLAADYATIVKQSRPSTTVDIQDRTYSTRCWRSSSKRHNDPEHYNEEVIQEFEHRDNRRQSRTVTDDRKHIAYIRAFSKVLLFNNNGQIDNTTGMLSFYDLSTIIRPVHLVLRDLPNLITYTTMSYYVNNYIN
ncbi:hypothetical protein HBI29_242430 [Parastagonospora nodorum]|nr:hypothetical protein HBI29_242430 [Parastagonospora nodorum]